MASFVAKQMMKDALPEMPEEEKKKKGQSFKESQEEVRKQADEDAAKRSEASLARKTSQQAKAEELRAKYSLKDPKAEEEAAADKKKGKKKEEKKGGRFSFSRKSKDDITEQPAQEEIQPQASAAHTEATPAAGATAGSGTAAGSTPAQPKSAEEIKKDMDASFKKLDDDNKQMKRKAKVWCMGMGCTIS